VRIGLLVVAAVVLLSVADLTSGRFNRFVQEHSLLATFITEAVLLVGAYLVIDEIIQRRETRRWSDVTSLGIRALSTRAEGPVEIIRRAVDEATGQTGRVDYQELLTERANEVGDWLRADEPRARSFAREMRQSASWLEEAIIRWGPTLVEDPDSAELINFLPDIVDSARAAADALEPERAWTNAERQLFRDSLLDVLKKADEFDRRLPRAP
jgi:hypothetical protein